MSHTPTPWMLRTFEGSTGMGKPLTIEGDILYHDPNDPTTFFGKWIATFPELVPERREQQKEDAAFIVTACNAHDELVAAARRATEHLSDSYVELDDLREALAKLDDES